VELNYSVCFMSDNLDNLFFPSLSGNSVSSSHIDSFNSLMWPWSASDRAKSARSIEPDSKLEQLR